MVFEGTCKNPQVQPNGKSQTEIRIIFYDVKPDVVRNQTGIYAKAFANHELANRTEVPEWKEALSMAANLSGWDLDDMANGYESKLIDSISKDILENLCHGPLHVGENLIGLDAHVNKMNLFRFVGSSKAHMIGICGIGGIGKTTLAKAIYNLMYTHFEECIFLEDVQGATNQHGLAHVLTKLLDDFMKTRVVTVTNASQGIMIYKQIVSSKCILLVLDSVDHWDQIEALAGSPDWFSPGSLIIFTGRDKQLLKSHKVDPIYDMGYLDYGNAVQLFSYHAFGEKCPTEEFKELTNQVMQYVQGHPLALKVLGCFFYDKPSCVWNSELDRLRVYPQADIQQVLRLSFVRLDHHQQRIFLDIASSLIGVNKDLAVCVLDGCMLFAETNIRILVDKSLLTISSTMLLQMHELIQAMAREIVREESDKPGDRSRLWITSEVCDVLNRNKVTEAIEVLVLFLENSIQKLHIDCTCFARMKNLRILKICDLELKNVEKMFESKPSKESKIKYSGSLDFLSNDLRFLCWHGCPFKFLPSNFYPENIVAIDMSYSHIKKIWTTPLCFRRLKVMNLSYCRNLTSTPDFTEITNLEELILEGCVHLLKVHPSIRMLKRLVVLNMRNCTRLASFPCKVEMDSLRVLILSGCLKVYKLIEVFGTINKLVELHVDISAVTEFPYLFHTLSNLQVLSVGRHQRIESRWWVSLFWPSSLQKRTDQQSQSLVFSYLASLRFLTRLNVSDCNISEVSSDIGSLSCLEVLKLSRNKFTCLPTSVIQLSRLKMLILNECKKLEEVPELPRSIISFHASSCTSLTKLGNLLDIHSSFRRRMVHLAKCPNLVTNLKTVLRMVLSEELTLNNLSQQLDVLFYQNRIPQWFTKRSIGNRIMVELPNGWCYNKFKGYATYVVFMPKKSSSSKAKYGQPGYTVNTFDKTFLDDALMRPLHVVREIMLMNVGSHVTWLHYSTSKPSWMEAKNIVTFSFCDFANIEVKECGVRIICEEDLQETSLNMTQGLLSLTQDAGLFHLSQEWSSANIDDEPPHCTRHIMWSAD